MKNIYVFILGERLAFFREEKGLDQGALGKVIGKSRQTMNTWEGKVKVRVDQETGLKLAKALEVDLKDLTDAKTPEGTKTMPMDVWEFIKRSNEESNKIHEKANKIHEETNSIFKLEFDRLWGLIEKYSPPAPPPLNKEPIQKNGN